MRLVGIIVTLPLVASLAASVALAEDGAGTSVTAAAGAVATAGLGKAATIHGDEAPGLVAFTFDDGPKVGTTDKVVDALLEYDVPATFFVVGHRLVGKRADGARALLARMLEHGFQIGSHSYSHPDLRTVSGKRLTREIAHTSEVIEKLTGVPVELFRPPYGALDKESAGHVARGGMTTVQWSIDSLDWRAPKAERMRQALVAGIVRENGGVILMHDTKRITARNIAAILDDLEATNCARLDAGEPPIVPVSLHYFLRDDGVARAIPPEVEARTQAYRRGLPTRCANRPKSDAADS